MKKITRKEEVMKYLVHYEARMDDGHDKDIVDIGYEYFDTEEEAKEAVEEFNQNHKFTNIEKRRRRFWTNTAWYFGQIPLG